MLNQYLGDFKPTGVVQVDVPRFLTDRGYPATAHHCSMVAAKAVELAEKFGAEVSKAEQAGYLHDISAVIPNEQRIAVARSQSVEVLAAEVERPMLIHQKLSIVLAREAFGVTDPEILSAIGCHTTLKARPTLLDKVVFLADKVAWDQPGRPPYLEAMLTAVDESLEAAVLVYLEHLWGRREELKVLHPWLVEARAFLLQPKTGEPSV